MENKSWTLRFTPDRHELIERLREKLKQAGREVETVHGVVSNASVFDAALTALERELDTEINTSLKK